jgi:hypothetical protein
MVIPHQKGNQAHRNKAMDIKQRQTLERRIVRAVANDALKQGYAVTVDDGSGPDALALDKSTRLADIMAAIMSTDEDLISFYKDGKREGAVYFVYGNDGYDVICDHTANDATYAIIKRADEIARKAADDGR